MFYYRDMSSLIRIFAADTVLIKKCDSIGCLLTKGIDIFSVIIGIVGVIGIVIFGIQYMTAGGNEEKTRKAKRRLLELVIGLVVYVVMYAVLTWLGVFENATPSI